MSSSPDLRPIVAAFGIDGQWLADRPFGNGHVHDTRLVSLQVAGQPVNLVLQRLNTNIFPDVAALMDNMVRVSDHLLAGFAANPPTGRREVLTPLRTPDGEVVVQDAAGGCWRAAPCVMAATSYDTVTDPAQVVAAAGGFGEFLRMLSDLDAKTLHTVIPGFHDLASRHAQRLQGQQRSAGRPHRRGCLCPGSGYRHAGPLRARPGRRGADDDLPRRGG